jgi:cytochrome c oxidase cbb3-type subunit 2
MLRHAWAVVAAVSIFPLTSHAQTASPPAPAAPGSIDGPGLYQQRCSGCHGKSGQGDGPFAGLLDPRPRDFTAGRFKFRTTETGSLPTDDDLAAGITNGLHGTSMPSWKPFLNPAQVGALISYLKSFSPRFSSEQPRPIEMGPELPMSPENSEAGRVVYQNLKCSACHGEDGKGTGAIAREMKDDWGRPTHATNLAEPWAFRGGSSLRDIFLRFRTGMNGTPMPSFLGAATEPELWQLAVYVKSLGRKPLWEMKGEEVSAFYREQEQRSRNDLVRQGEYIAGIAGCAFCHSPFRGDGTMMDEFKYAGGLRFEVVPFGTFVSYNLTSDKATGLGSWTDDEIKKFVTSGVRRDGSRMLPFPMPWPNYANLKPQDLNALVAFLRSLPPVSNAIPPPRSPGIVTYLTGKFRMLILKKDPPAYSYPGNAGIPAMAGGVR